MQSRNQRLQSGQISQGVGLANGNLGLGSLDGVVGLLRWQVSVLPIPSSKIGSIRCLKNNVLFVSCFSEPSG